MRAFIVAVVVGTYAQAQCPGDLDGNNRVDVAELVTAVDSAVRGCDPDADLLFMLGDWRFDTYTDTEVFSSFLQLDRLTVVQGTTVFVGTDLDEGDAILGGRAADAGAPNLGYEYGLFNRSSVFCELYAFTPIRSRQAVLGVNYVSERLPSGICSATLFTLPFTGVRLDAGRAASTEEAGTALRRFEQLMSKE